MTFDTKPPRSFRIPFALSVAALLLAAQARGVAAGGLSSGIPSPANCTVDHVLIGSYDLTGANAGMAPCIANATPGFDVYVRDVANIPIPGAVVTIIFSGTGTGIRPYQNQRQSNVTVTCTNRELDIIADANGHAVFVPRFGHWAESAVIPVYANGVLLRNVEARSADYNDDGTVNLIDLGTFTSDYTDPITYHAKSDFDDCSNTKLGDFAFFAEQYLAGISGPVELVCP
jgi:hypothetical protein